MSDVKMKGAAPLVLFACLAAATSATAQPLTFRHLAGSAPGAVDGTGTGARFWRPSGVAVDGSGNVLVADQFNHVVRRIAAASWEVTTLAGRAGSQGAANGIGYEARFQNPQSVAADASGNAYVVDQYGRAIRKIVVATGEVTTLAYLQAAGVAADRAGNLFVADDWYHTIRKIVVATGEVTTLAGLAGATGGTDGFGSGARFTKPGGVAVDASGNVYVADSGNSTIRKVVAATGEVTTLAGLAGSRGGADGSGSGARFDNPAGVAVDGSGNVFVADELNHTIRKVVVATGEVTTLAGMAGVWGSADGSGSGARFDHPTGIAVGAEGNVYVADFANHAIRKVVVSTGEVTTVGGPEAILNLSGRLGSSMTEWGHLEGVAVDGGSVYVTDTEGYVVRRIALATGRVTTLAGLLGYYGYADGIGSEARFRYPTSVAADRQGSIYVTDRDVIRKVVVATGEVTTLAGKWGETGDADGTGTAARFAWPRGLAIDPAGILYVADGAAVRKVVLATGEVTTLAGRSPGGGCEDGVGSAARVSPVGIALDGAGNLFVTDGNTVRKVVIATGEVTTLAGRCGRPGYADGFGREALFFYPRGVVADGEGSIYVADQGNQIIRKIVVATGEVTTLAGVAGEAGATDGTGGDARFVSPGALAADGAGTFYLAENAGNSIRRFRRGLSDRALVLPPVGPGGTPRQLDVSPDTASSWLWEEVRKPSTSRAPLSTANTRNPTFAPDVADEYVFRLTATDRAGVESITYVAVTGCEGTSCVPGPSTLCLLGNRIAVTADWADYGGGSGRGTAVPLTSDSGYFWFFSPDNVEAVVRASATCGEVWDKVAIYVGGLTDLDVTLRVTDTRAGVTTTYRNPLGAPFQRMHDRPFQCPACATPRGAVGSGPTEGIASALHETSRPPSPQVSETCRPSGATLCLFGGRFEVRATCRDASERYCYAYGEGPGHAVTLTSDSGYFWFADPANLDAVVKMVGFCGSSPGAVGFYAGGLSDLEMSLTVRDTVTGLTKTYGNPRATPFGLIRDGPFSCP